MYYCILFSWVGHCNLRVKHLVVVYTNGWGHWHHAGKSSILFLIFIEHPILWYMTCKLVCHRYVISFNSKIFVFYPHQQCIVYHIGCCNVGKERFNFGFKPSLHDYILRNWWLQSKHLWAEEGHSLKRRVVRVLWDKNWIWSFKLYQSQTQWLSLGGNT